MSKKKNKNSRVGLIRKGIALVSAVVTFVFFFLEIVALRTKSTVFGKESVTTEGVKFSDILFNEDYEIIREELSLATTVMWVVFAMVVLSVVVIALSLIMKKGATMAKFGSGLLLIAMVLLFVVNFDKVTLDLYVAKGDTNISNITALYFVSLAMSGVGVVSTVGLKK